MNKENNGWGFIIYCACEEKDLDGFISKKHNLLTVLSSSKEFETETDAMQYVLDNGLMDKYKVSILMKRID